MKRAHRRLGAFLVLGVALAACGGLAPPPGAPSGAEERAYRQALAVLARDRGQGEAALRSFLSAHPHSHLADDAALRLAELALADGRDDPAIALLRFVLREHPTADRSDTARLMLAQLERERGESDAAYETATAIRLSLLTPEERRRVHRLLADLAAEREDRPAQLRWLSWVRSDQKTEDDLASVDEEIGAVLASMDVAALGGAAEQLGRRIPAARARLRQAELLLWQGDRDGAHAALAAASQLPLGPGDPERLARLEATVADGALPGELLARLPRFDEALPVRPPDPALLEGTLGVVVPLSGPYGDFGEEALQGVLLAAGVFDASRPESSGGLRVRVLDSAGRPERAAAAVRQLAQDPDVLAIIGPLLGPEAEAGAVVAQEAGVPLLTLTRREPVAEAGRWVLRFGTSPRLEARLLAEYAVRELGLTRFAILYPDDAYGQAMRAAFWDTLDEQGAEVVGVSRYPLAATDFAKPIRRLIGFEMLGRAEQAALAEREQLLKRAKRLPADAATELREEAAALTAPDGSPLPPFVDFEAVFLPDSHEKAALIASHLAFHEVQGVRLLGPSGWNHPDLLAIAGKHVDGAIFAASFYADSAFPFVAGFTRRFRATFEREPGFVAAQAFDAANLVLVQRFQDRTEREDVLRGLLATRAYPGASGVISIGPDGSAWKRPHLLGVDRGRIVSIDETGEPPYLRPPSGEEEDRGVL